MKSWNVYGVFRSYFESCIILGSAIVPSLGPEMLYHWLLVYYAIEFEAGASRVQLSASMFNEAFLKAQARQPGHLQVRGKVRSEVKKT